MRLPEFLYDSYGPYFVTIDAYQNQFLFGDVVDGSMRLSEIGRIVQEEWLRTAEIRPGVELDEFQVMPNHFHGILAFIEGNDQSTGRTLCAPTTSQSARFTRARRSLGSAIAGFKAKTTSRIRQLTNNPSLQVWQRGFFETVIRDDAHLERVCDYIRENPARWEDRRDAQRAPSTVVGGGEQIPR